VRPLRLTLKGFTSFREEQTIEFDGLEVFAIAGPTGSGKSSILDAMTYALYGQVERVGVQCSQLISQGLTRMSVTFDFRVGPSDYRIVRSTAVQGPAHVDLEQKVSGAWQSIGEGGDRARDVKDRITKILGLDYDAFTRSILLPQNKFAEFLTGEPKKRRAILIELLGLGLFTDMSARAGTMARDARVQCDDRAAVVAREYAGVDAAAVAAADAAAEAASGQLSKVQVALAAVSALEKQAEEHRRAATDLASSSDEARKTANGATSAADALSRLSKLATAGDRAIADSGQVAKATASALIVARKERLAADKKWGGMSDLGAAKARADDLPRLRKAAAAADTAQERAAARRPKALARTKAEAEAVAKATARVRRAATALEAAKRALEEAQHADQVASLVTGLKKGDPCPVCGVPLAGLPKSGTGPLRGAKAALKDCERADDEAREALTAAKLILRGSEKDLQQLDSEIQHRKEQLGEAEVAVTAAERGLRKVFGPKLPEDPSRELGTRIAQLTEFVEAEEAARAQDDDAQRELAQAQQKRRLLDAEITRERTRLEVNVDALYARCRTLGVAAAALTKLPTVSAAGTDLDAAVASGREIAASLVRVASHLKGESESRGKAESTLLRDGLRAADGVVASASSLGVLVATVTGAERAALRTLTAAEQHAALAHERLKRRTAMEIEIATLRQRADAFAALALELRADRIIAFLQAEALRAMAVSASTHLAELSGNRYTLVCREEDEFCVVDQWGAGEERSVSTLSGGETFLASLALALGLAENVRALSTTERARLDSLFIDEGFGSLDPDTLEIATNAMQQLAGDGRLVGVITHIRELTEQFTRIEVEKKPEGSTLRFVSWPGKPPVHLAGIVVGSPGVPFAATTAM
jgi:exonuclease SbcC